MYSLLFSHERILVYKHQCNLKDFIGIVQLKILIRLVSTIGACMQRSPEPVLTTLLVTL